MPAITQEITETLIRENINRAVCDVFKTMLHRATEMRDSRVTHGTEGNPLLPQGVESPHLQVVGTVGFLGDVNGLIYLYFDGDFAEHCTGHMLGMSVEEVREIGDEVINDAIGEITNMTVGSFKNGLSDQGYPCKLTIPSILRGRNFCIEPISDSQRFTHTFDTEGQKLIADILLKCGNKFHPATIMRNKILTVDDSKTVRIIVRKTFKSYDCEILEAGNGVEGLALAAKAMPDLILLDVTMPVMDGVEMLTKLKADPQLKGIPVMMLTAEGGRDHVLKIAKIGVRDYIVKPFEDDVLIEKAGRIIDLKPLADGPAKARSLTDPASILIVEDKPAIIQQIQDGLKHTPWKIHGAATQGEAIDFCTKTPPDLVIVSLSLPDESAFALFRLIRTNVKTKYTPVFGLVVKTETGTLQQAQMVGFTTVITKPIDALDLESRIAKAMNLDTSQRYFGIEDGCFIVKMPEHCTPAVLAEISTYLKPKLTEAVNAGHNKAVINTQALKSLHMGVIKQLVTAMQLFKDTGVNFTLVGNNQLMTECKGFEETRSWTFFETLADAKASFAKVPAQPAMATA